jgi:hypothetical protein
MPLELGIDLGCKAFSNAHRSKSFLIFDKEQYRFHASVSDIAGQDIRRHANDPKTAIIGVRDWLRAETGNITMRGGAAMYSRYVTFRRELPAICDELGLDIHELTFVDLSYAIFGWLRRSI